MTGHEESVVDVLRKHANADADGAMVTVSRQAVEEAIEILEFLYGQMHGYSPEMDGTMTYRFHGGWPMTHCKGKNREEAIKAAIQEVKRVSLNDTP